MAESDDDSQRTEEPTQKRLDDALKKGQVAFSREVTSFLLLVVLTLIIAWIVPGMMKQTVYSFSKFIASPHSLRIDSDNIQSLSAETLSDLAVIMLIPFVGVIFVILLSAFMQNGLVISFDPLMPKLERISPLKGLKRIFSMKSVIEFIKGLIKITIIAIVAFIAVYPEMSHLYEVFSYSILGIVKFLGTVTSRILIGVCAAMALIAVIDFLYQRFEFTKSMRMSKQDIKDEFKQMEGNPEIKAKLRDIRNQRSRKRMMAAVPEADVVITNPTHYSVALKYAPDIANAPLVVAKGQDFIALKIREIAKEHKIPLVQNPPLARALFASVELDEEIPLEHYNAVAEIIRYVYKLKGRKL